MPTDAGGRGQNGNQRQQQIMQTNIPAALAQRLETTAAQFGLRARWVLREALSVYLDSLTEDSDFRESAQQLARDAATVPEPRPVLPAVVPPRRKEALQRIRSGAVRPLFAHRAAAFGDTERVCRQWAHDPSRGDLMCGLRDACKSGSIERVVDFVRSHGIQPEEFIDEAERYCPADILKTAVDAVRAVYSDSFFTKPLPELQYAEADVIVTAFEANRGHWGKTAKALGLSLWQLRDRRAKYGLMPARRVPERP